MSWFTRRPSKEMLAVQEAQAKVEETVERQKSAISKLMQTLDAIPLDDALSGLGTNLTETKRNGH